MSGSRTRVGTHWRKPPTRVYDYNYNLGEHYYKPQLRHADQKFSGRRGSPPRAKYFAERFAEEPVYGISGPPNWRTAGPRRSSLDDFGFGRRPSGDRFADRFGPTDSDLGRPSRFGQEEDGDLGFGRRRAGADDSEFGRPSRFGFGDRLDVGGAGAGGRGASPGVRGASPGVRFARGTGGDSFDDAFDEAFFQRGKRFGRDGPLSADPDFMTEDPFKQLKARRALAAAGRDDEPSADQMIEDMKREAESSASRFRSKLKAKRAQEELEDSLGGDDSFGTESRVDKIRSRARARLAEIEDDFPSLSLKSSGAARGASDDYDSLGGASKSIRISKRSVRSTIESD